MCRAPCGSRYNISQPCFGHARPLRAAVYQHVSWSSPGSAPAGARQRWLGPPHRPASPARRLSCPSRGGEAACRQPGHTSLLAPLIPRRLHLSDRRPRHPPPLPRLSSAPMSLAPPNPVALARRLPPPARRLHREAVATGQALLVQMAQHRGSAHQQGRIARARGEAAPGACQRERVVRRTRRLFTTTSTRMAARHCSNQFACYSGGRPPISTSRRGTPGSTRRSSGHQSTRASGARRRTSISGPPGPAGQRGWGGWTDRRSAPRSTRARGGRRRTSTSRPATAGSRQQRAPSARPRAPPGAGQTTCTSHGAARS